MRLAADHSGQIQAAIIDLRTGQSWSLGRGRPQAEASVVKLDILETLLAQHRPSGAGSPAGLPAADRPVARLMIEDSDNNAATSLWNAAGGPGGIAVYNHHAGLRSTTPSACVECPDFPWPGWGLTTTTPADQIVLLRRLVAPSPLLTPSQRRYALGLMRHVTADQRWGVSAGIPAGVAVALKNGWLPLNSSGDWQVNSVGWISGKGRDYLLAVLTTGNATEQAGIDVVSRISRTVWRRLG